MEDQFSGNFDPHGGGGDAGGGGYYGYEGSEPTGRGRYTPPPPDYKQLLGHAIINQNLLSKWTGEGVGGAHSNAMRMGEILAGIGITDLKQFGRLPDGSFGNKLTGQAVPNTYGERQTGDFFGGTYEGKGNTGYGVQFGADGTPYFYTVGKSSNDLVKAFEKNPLLGSVAQIGAAYFGGPLGSAALNAAMGKSPEDILKSAALSYLGNAAGSAVSGMEGITDVLGETGTNIASNVAKQFVGSGGQNIDPVKVLLSSGLINGSGDGPNSSDFIEGYFKPGGEGYVESTIQDTTGLDEGPTIPVNEAPTFNVVDQLLNSGMPSPDEDFMPTLPAPTETKPEEETDWNALYNTGLSPEEIANREALMGSLPGQELQIDPENWESFDTNLSDIMTNKGGYTSQWQTVGNDRVMLDDQGTGIGINTETGESYALDEDQVNSMIKNGVLNTAASGYVAATGGTGNTPGGSGKASTAPVKPAAPVKPTAPTTPVAPAPTGTAPATSTALNAPQQTSNADLLNLLGSKPELANIKSFKELFGEDLFGGKYVPPSAGGDQSGGSANYGRRDESSTASQGEGEEQLFRGGRVDDFDVDALLQILRS